MRTLTSRITMTHLAHRCAACFKALPIMSPKQEAESRKEAYAQGMTDKQIDDPTYAAKICDECWNKSGGLAAPLARQKQPKN